MEFCDESDCQQRNIYPIANNPDVVLLYAIHVAAVVVVVVVVIYASTSIKCWCNDNNSMGVYVCLCVCVNGCRMASI